MKKRMFIIVLTAITIVLLTACSTPTDLTQDIKPTDCADILMSSTGNMLKSLELDNDSFIGESINPNGFNYLKDTISVLGHEFDMSIESYNNLIQRYSFSIVKESPTEIEKGIFTELYDRMVKEYGEPDTDMESSTRYVANLDYFMHNPITVHDEWHTEDFDMHLRYDFDKRNIMTIEIIVVVKTN